MLVLAVILLLYIVFGLLLILNLCSIIMKLHTYTKLDERMCCGQERQLLPSWFLSYLPLSKFHTAGTSATLWQYLVVFLFFVVFF